MRIRCYNCKERLVNGEIIKMFVRNGDLMIHVHCSNCDKYVDAEYSIDINGIVFVGGLGK